MSPTADGVAYAVTANPGEARTAAIVVTSTSTFASEVFAVTQEAASAVSAPAGSPPVIVVQPRDLVVHVREPLSVSVTANGGALTYQWRLEGAAVAGASGATVAVPGIERPGVYHYDVIVSNPFGQVTSTVARVEVRTDGASSAGEPAAARPTDEGSEGGNGCNCNVGDRSSHGGGLAGLIVLAWTWTRRRRQP